MARKPASSRSSTARPHLPMATSQDHKRVCDGDTGPNTGGMGAYSPAPVVTPEVHARVMREIVEPTVRGMIADGIPFTGFLYAGPDDRCRRRAQGDRVQRALRRPGNAAGDDAPEIGSARPARSGHRRPTGTSATRRLGSAPGAGRGDGRGRTIPDTPRTGDVIHGLDAPLPADSKVFHAGTRLGRRPRRHRRRPRAVRLRARRHACATRSSAPTPPSRRSPGTANSTAATSAGAPSPASAADCALSC